MQKTTRVDQVYPSFYPVMNMGKLNKLKIRKQGQGKQYLKRLQGILTQGFFVFKDSCKLNSSL